jgi:putative two-component system response regulator
VLEQRPPLVLVVDDVRMNRELLDGLLHELGYEVREARDGVEALEAIDEQEPDLVLLDIDMPRLDGLTVCQRIKADRQRRLIPVVIITAHQDRETRIRGLAAGADDFLTKPFDATELRVRTNVLLRDRALNRELDAAESVVMSLARIVEARDRYTIHHAERVGLYSREIGRAVGRTEDELEILYKGGVMHDLGKIVVPSEILLKRGPLTEVERALMETHSAEGAHFIEPLRSAVRFLPIVRHHHERFDGMGYPDHLVAEEIPFGARAAAIADAWDAMTFDRPYRHALSRDQALQQLRIGAGTQWDAELIEAFQLLLERGLADRVMAHRFASEPAA